MMMMIITTKNVDGCRSVVINPVTKAIARMQDHTVGDMWIGTSNRLAGLIPLEHHMNYDRR